MDYKMHAPLSEAKVPEEKPRHIDGQCTSSCRRVGCPDEEMTEGEIWDAHKKEMKKMRENRREVFEEATVKELEALGYRVRKVNAYQFRINERLDIYPSNKRYHDIKEFKRGDIRGTTFVGFVKQYLPQ